MLNCLTFTPTPLRLRAGPSGCGKTTLLNVLAVRSDPEYRLVRCAPPCAEPSLLSPEMPEYPCLASLAYSDAPPERQRGILPLLDTRIARSRLRTHAPLRALRPLSPPQPTHRQPPPVPPQPARGVRPRRRGDVARPGPAGVRPAGGVLLHQLHGARRFNALPSVLACLHVHSQCTRRESAKVAFGWVWAP